jgi:hypothetical protein
MAKTAKLLYKLRKVLEQLKSADLVLVDDDGTVVVLADVEYAILDVSQWTAEDWAEVDNESNYARLETAVSIDKKYS